MELAELLAVVVITIYCKKCSAAFQAAGVIPPVCPECKVDTSWTTSQPHADLSFPFRLSRNDKRFLKSIQIESEEPV